MFRFFWSSRICLRIKSHVNSNGFDMRKNIKDQLLSKLCLPDRDLEHVWDEEDDEGDPHEKDDRRGDASPQLILPLDLAYDS